MEPITELRKKIASGKYCIGPSITLSDSSVIEAVSDNVDFIWVDQEHVLMNPYITYSHFLAGRLKKVPVLVRVTSVRDTNIKPIIDSGASGIIIPQIQSSDDAKSIVEQCRFNPLGRRGYGGKIAADYSSKDWVKFTNEEFFIAVMIENQDAVQDIENIVKVPGIDLILIGPMDLSSSLGVPGDIKSKKVLSTIDYIISKAKSAGVAVGVGTSLDFSFIGEMMDRGVKFLQVSSDYDYLKEYTRFIRSKINGE